MVTVLNFLLVLALLALLVVGVKYILGLMGVTIPQPIWTIVCVIICLVVLIWLFNGGVPVLIGAHR